MLTLLRPGRSRSGIAEQSSISEATMMTHTNNLIAQAGIRDRADAVRKAMSYELI